MRVSNTENPVPIWERTTITLPEAAQYTTIGINKLYEPTYRKDCDFVLWVGSSPAVGTREPDLDGGCRLHRGRERQTEGTDKPG